MSTTAQPHKSKLEDRIADFRQETEKLVHAIKRDLRHADESDRQADELVRRSESVTVYRGDVTERDALLRRVGPLRENAEQLRAGIAVYADRVEALAELERSLRSAAHRDLTKANAALEQATARQKRASALYGGCSRHSLAKVRELITEWRRRYAIQSPQPAPPKAEPAEAVKAVDPNEKPACPRCKNNRCVRQLAQNQWECRAPYHGAGLKFSIVRRELVPA